MIRGRELYAVGAFDEAFIEFEDLVDQARADGNTLDSYRLALYLRELGVYRESIIAAADVIIASGFGTLEVPPFLARMRFPAYYIDVIQPEAAARGIDPLLMLSLIRQESLFNTFATAGAGEKGMMQVIPSTGQYIAEQLNWPDYQHSDLFRPYAGVAFGAFYIDEQLERFNQNPIAALAAYNAGTGPRLRLERAIRRRPGSVHDGDYHRLHTALRAIHLPQLQYLPGAIQPRPSIAQLIASIPQPCFGV